MNVRQLASHRHFTLVCQECNTSMWSRKNLCLDIELGEFNLVSFFTNIRIDSTKWVHSHGVVPCLRSSLVTVVSLNSGIVFSLPYHQVFTEEVLVELLTTQLINVAFSSYIPLPALAPYRHLSFPFPSTAVIVWGSLMVYSSVLLNWLISLMSRLD